MDFSAWRLEHLQEELKSARIRREREQKYEALLEAAINKKSSSSNGGEVTQDESPLTTAPTY